MRRRGWDERTNRRTADRGRPPLRQGRVPADRSRTDAAQPSQGTPNPLDDSSEPTAHSETKERAMQIRLGYELVYECRDATPMNLVLNLHPTRVPDIIVADHLMTDPPLPVRA